MTTGVEVLWRAMPTTGWGAEEEAEDAGEDEGDELEDG